VILVDLHLPKRDGLEVLSATRREPVLEKIHVIVMASAASPHEQADVQALGGDFRINPAEVIAICKEHHSAEVTALA
jgi:CheY-like chemotaxis protein